MAGPDIHLVGKADVGAESLHDAQDVPADVVDTVGPEAIFDDLTDVEIIPLTTEPQEGRVFSRNVLGVRAAQRFELPPQAAVQLESDEDGIALRELHDPPFNQQR